MVPRAPAHPGHSAQPDSQGQITHPVPFTEPIEVYNDKSKEVIVKAEKDVGIMQSVVSEACLERLGHLQQKRPIGKEVFLVEGVPATEYIELGVVVGRRNLHPPKTSFHFYFVVVKGLSVDIIFGSWHVEIITEEPRNLLLPYALGKKTQAEIEERAAADKEAEKKDKIIEDEEREATRKKMEEMRGKASVKEGEGSKKDA